MRSDDSRWPGEAAVIVSVVHVSKGRKVIAALCLNHKLVDRITAFLFQGTVDEDPVP